MENKILVVEDSDLMARFIIDIMDKYRTVEIARNGKDALKKVARSYFNLIVSDIQMPVMDGIEFYKAAAEIDSDIKNRFLFFAASDSHDHMLFFMENNLPFLHKLTSQPDDLTNAIQKILNKPG